MGHGQILVVDDEVYVTTMLAQKLRASGHAVRCAGDGEEGFAAALEVVPDLIVTDFQMPLLSGLEMAKRLRQTPGTAGVPLLMLTARGHRIEAAELAATNIRQMLPKPFSMRSLTAAVEALLTAAVAG
jgi:DNA-binding response OmpR family regulator